MAKFYHPVSRWVASACFQKKGKPAVVWMHLVLQSSLWHFLYGKKDVVASGEKEISWLRDKMSATRTARHHLCFLWPFTLEPPNEQCTSTEYAYEIVGTMCRSRYCTYETNPTYLIIWYSKILILACHSSAANLNSYRPLNWSYIGSGKKNPVDFLQPELHPIWPSGQIFQPGPSPTPAHTLIWLGLSDRTVHDHVYIWYWYEKRTIRACTIRKFGNEE